MSVDPPRPPSAWSRSELSFLLPLCVGMLGLYAATLCRTVFFYDSAEFAGAAAVLGIPHPPGYPLYTLLGHVYVLLIPGEPALATNIMSAVHGVLVLALLFVLQRQLGATRPAALLGSLVLGTGPSFWLNSVVTEVYTTGLVFAMLTFVLLGRAERESKPKWFYLAALTGGLGFSSHMFVATLGLGYVVLVVYAARVGQRSAELAGAAWPSRPRLLTGVSLAAIMGAALYLYLPVRASMAPTMMFMKLDHPKKLFWMLSGGPYQNWFVSDYDVLQRLLGVLGLLTQHLTVFGLVIALLGLGVLCVQRLAWGIALALAAIGNLWFFFEYDVHDLEVFFLPAAAVLCACIGPAVSAARKRLAHRTSTRIIADVALVLSFAYFGVRAAVVYPTVDLSREMAAREYGEALVRELPANAIMLSFSTPPEWKHRAVFEFYFQDALGQRRDVERQVTPNPQALKAILESGRPVYMYAPVAQLAPVLQLVPEGRVLRVHRRGLR